VDRLYDAYANDGADSCDEHTAEVVALFLHRLSSSIANRLAADPLAARVISLAALGCQDACDLARKSFRAFYREFANRSTLSLHAAAIFRTLHTALRSPSWDRKRQTAVALQRLVTELDVTTLAPPTTPTTTSTTLTPSAQSTTHSTLCARSESPAQSEPSASSASSSLSQAGERVREFHVEFARTFTGLVEQLRVARLWTGKGELLEALATLSVAAKSFWSPEQGTSSLPELPSIGAMLLLLGEECARKQIEYRRHAVRALFRLQSVFPQVDFATRGELLRLMFTEATRPIQGAKKTSYTRGARDEEEDDDRNVRVSECVCVYVCACVRVGGCV
jgi:hypothetical protein